MLIRSAFSSNIKERRDCSTALFDRAGRMIVQAEHIPVHLGAMPEAVAAVMAHDPAPDDVWVLNDPYTGGTHLPDITLVSSTELGFAVSRAHHADVGGIEPASLPAFSTVLSEEGLVIPPDAARRRRRRADRLELAQPGRAPRRPARPAGRTPPCRAAQRRARRASRPRPGRRSDAGAVRVLRPLCPGRHRAASRRPLRGRGRRRGRRPRPRRSASPSPSLATRSRSTSRAPRPSTVGTSTVRSP